MKQSIFSCHKDTKSSKAAYKVHKVFPVAILCGDFLSRLLSLYLKRVFFSLFLCVQIKQFTKLLYLGNKKRKSAKTFARLIFFHYLCT